MKDVFIIFDFSSSSDIMQQKSFFFFFKLDFFDDGGIIHEQDKSENVVHIFQYP